MNTRRAILVAVVVVVVVAGLSRPVCPQQAAAGTEVWLQRLQRWLQAIERHEPGRDDGEARALASWTRSDLRTLLADLLALRDGLARAYEAASDSRSSRVITYAGHQFEKGELQQLLGLTDEEARRGDINRVLWGGALLHSDVAMLVPSEDRPVAGRTMMVRVRDGQPGGYEYPVAAQWEFARGLLDAIRPDASRDAAVLLWYQATAAYLLRNSRLSDATAQLNRGRQLFPADADLLFFSGCVHEAYTAPSLQDGIRAVVLPRGQTIAIGSSRSHLQEAERFFREALERNGRLTEARVRLGRILGLLGRHEEASDHLRQAATTIGDSQVMYYAYMFLGEEESALGHGDAARDWYERAAAIYKGAQSPLFGLSHLASQLGDNDAAMRAVERIRQLPADEVERADPWVEYYVAAGRNAAALLGNLLAMAPRAGRR